MIVLINAVRFNVVDIVPPPILTDSTALTPVVITLPDCFRQVIPSKAPIIVRAHLLPEVMSRTLNTFSKAFSRAEKSFRVCITSLVVALPTLLAGIPLFSSSAWSLSLTGGDEAFFPAIQKSGFCWGKYCSTLQTGAWRQITMIFCRIIAGSIPFANFRAILLYLSKMAFDGKLFATALTAQMRRRFTRDCTTIGAALNSLNLARLNTKRLGADTAVFNNAMGILGFDKFSFCHLIPIVTQQVSKCK